ncbi:hypothetical protein ACJMK2_005977 [Sinanodonta woodiana]|uniref:Uncharacterized protein n=1 Tax=Sinanodonta woodiana TaxID=1069815 RepID=A0ABD3VT33_SINWO
MYTNVSGRQCSSIWHLRDSVVLLSFILIVYVPKINTQTSDDAKSILKKLFTTDAYNKAVRPTYDQSLAVNVSISYSLTGIIEFDSQKESLTTSGYLIITWNDYYLQWDPANYNGTSIVFIHQDKVWKPDIALQNGILEFKGLGSSDLLVTFTNDGFVSWWPYAILQSTCTVDITYFPFDTQSCNLIFTAWSYYNTEVLLTYGSNGLMLNQYEENSAWIVAGSDVGPKKGSTDATLIFTLKLKRKPLFYLLNIVLPVLMLSVMNVCVFVLPAKAGEKASFSVTVFLSLFLLLTVVAAMLPQNSTNVSFFGIFMVIMISYSTLTVTLTMFQLLLNSRDVNINPIPSWLITLTILMSRRRSRTFSKVRPAAQSQNAHIISISEYTDETTLQVKKSEVLPPSADTKLKVTWNNVSNSLDIVLFLVSVIIISLILTLLMVNVAK